MAELNSQEFIQSMQQIMHDFKEGGRLRDKEGLRLARRTAQIIRWSSIGMVLLGIALLSLLYILTKDLVVITDNIVAMSKYTQSISRNMDTMKGTMVAIKDDMGDMNKAITQLNKETGLMRSSVVQMNTSIAVFPVMTGNVKTMSQDFKVLNSQIGRMTLIMESMARDTNDMSKPMRIMPWN